MDVPTDIQITIYWSEEMNLSSAEGAFSSNPTITCIWIWDGWNQTCIPSNPLVPDTIYNLTISTDAKDLAGNVMSSRCFLTFGTKGRTPTDSIGMLILVVLAVIVVAVILVILIIRKSMSEGKKDEEKRKKTWREGSVRKGEDTRKEETLGKAIKEGSEADGADGGPDGIERPKVTQKAERTEGEGRREMKQRPTPSVARVSRQEAIERVRQRRRRI
jgi:hypothetical protein